MIKSFLTSNAQNNKNETENKGKYCLSVTWFCSITILMYIFKYMPVNTRRSKDGLESWNCMNQTCISTFLLVFLSDFISNWRTFIFLLKQRLTQTEKPGLSLRTMTEAVMRRQLSNSSLHTSHSAPLEVIYARLRLQQSDGLFWCHLTPKDIWAFLVHLDGGLQTRFVLPRSFIEGRCFLPHPLQTKRLRHCSSPFITS